MPEITEYIQTIVAQAAQNIDVSLEANHIHLEHPADPQHGDYSTNVALTQFSHTKSFANPRTFATELSAEVKKVLSAQTDTFIQSVDVAGPGFINFTLSQTYLLDATEKIVQKGGAVIQQQSENKKVVVEFSSPNIAKPFTVGHLRSTIIGNSVANLFAATGWTVFRDNHLGDWGTQFGKQIYAIKTWGNEAQIELSAEPIKDLVALYIKFYEEAEKNPALEEEGRAWFKKLEDGDQEAHRLWRKCIAWSLKEFKRIYQLLDVSFTENDGLGYGESFFEDKMPAVLTELKEKKLLKESEGAQLVFFPDDKYPPLMITKKDGATLYATRDLATDKFRLQHYGKDIVVVNEVGAEQALYFQQLYAIEHMLSWYGNDQRVHVKHGLYRFKDSKMSTRKGNVIWLQDVLNQAFEKVKQRAASAHVQKNASTLSDGDIWKIAVGALKWNDLKRESIKDIVFDWDEILSVQGNSGPYVQYVYARCRSVLEKAEQQDPTIAKKVMSTLKINNELNAEEKTVLRLLYQFNEVVQRAVTEFAPHYVCTYLFELAQAFNAFYNQHTILGTNGDTDLFRVQLTTATALITQRGLQLLGIQTVEKM